MAEPLRVAGIVLAAGASTRMGTNKVLLQLDGEPLVLRAVRRAQAARLHPIVVVAGNEASRVKTTLAHAPCEVVVNADYAGLMSGSMHRGLWALPADADAAVVVLADMIDVTPSMIVKLVQTARGSDAPLVVSRYGTISAPPILFHRVLFDELLAWNGEGCGKAVVRAHAHEAEYVDWPRESIRDVDTPEDWKAVAPRL